MAIHNILVTGSGGFIGRNLLVRLLETGRYNILEYDIDSGDSDLTALLKSADLIYHLAGANRPKDQSDFQCVNVDLTSHICNSLIDIGKSIPIVFSSSTQAELDNPYGISKRMAEEHLLQYSEKTGAKVAIYRLPNVFGKWSKPNYNSVVATFCYNIARDLPINIHDPESPVSLVYIDDVVDNFISHIEYGVNDPRVFIKPVYTTTVGELADSIRQFKKNREGLHINDFSNPFIRALYATWLSFLDKNDFSINPDPKSDDRGNLCELFKFPRGGQVFVSTTKPGITRGNHYHYTKTEKFCVIHGDAVIRFRKIGTKDIIEYPVNGNNISIVDIPPGYTHSIENTGKDDMICLFWSSEIFNPDHPDTFFEKVMIEVGD